MREAIIAAARAAGERIGAEAEAGDGPDGRARIERSVAHALRVAREAERALAGDPAALRAAQQAFRAAASEALSRSTIMDRSIRKPRGYAGDHALIDAIYRQATAGRGIGRVLDEAVLACEAGRSVVERLGFAADWLAPRLEAHPGSKVVDLACGPCRLERALLEGGRAARARLVAVDGDHEALAYARDVVLREHAAAVELHHDNAIRIARDRGSSPLLGGARYIVSLGLFDYLPRQIAVGLLRALGRALRPGGELLVGNFADDNPSRTFMEWFGDWPLIHRSENEFVELFVAAGFDADALSCERERPGGSVLLVTARGAPALSRAAGPRAAAAS